MGGDPCQDRGDTGDDVGHGVGGLGALAGPSVPQLFGGRERVVTENGAVVDGLDEVVFGVEREVEGLHGDAGACSDGFHGGGSEAELAEQLVGGVEHLSASAGGLVPTRGWLGLDILHSCDSTRDHH